MNFKRPIYNRSRLSAGDSRFTVGLYMCVCFGQQCDQLVRPVLLLCLTRFMLPKYSASVQPALWFLYAKFQRNEAYINVFAHNCEICLRCFNALFDRKPSS